MKFASFPIDEELRITDLLSCDILDSEKEKEYDELIELASQITNCPIAMISFIDRKRQWFKSTIQICHQETRRDIALCAHTILRKEMMIINDARTDERFFDNPLVTEEPNIVFYAGSPIVSSNGYTLGSVCVIDNVPREDLTQEQKSALRIISSQVSKLLELRVKNKMIIKNATSQIASEKRNLQIAIKENDRMNNFIAYELHENLAQHLAATKLFVESAEKSSDNSNFFLNKAKESIGQIIGEIQKLSKSIMPTTYQNVNYFDIIKNFAIEYGHKNGMKIMFENNGVINWRKPDIGLNLFRIIEYQLAISKNRFAKVIVIRIKISECIDIYVHDDGALGGINNWDNMVLHSKMSTRVDLLCGMINQSVTKKNNSLHIKFKKKSNCQDC